MKLKTYTGPELRELRRSVGLTQNEFWIRFGITQSGASRYESGRALPRPLQILLNISLGTERKVEAIVDELREGTRPTRR